MNSISFTVEEENLICMYHHDDRRRTMTAISDALPDMDADMRQLAGQTIQKLHNMTDAAFEEAKFSMALSADASRIFFLPFRHGFKDCFLLWKGKHTGSLVSTPESLDISGFSRL